MKVLVTGADGQIGYDVVNELKTRGHHVIGSSIHHKTDEMSEYVYMDITDRAAVHSTIESLNPDSVIHCAAWTAVDAAEEIDNRDRVFAINAAGTENIAKACAETGSSMLYISTDYVFDGRGDAPWEPDCRSFAPLNVYGESKLQGEFAVANTLDKYFIVRTSWAFGTQGENFVSKILQASHNHDAIRVVSDQIGMPTYSRDLAELLVDMIGTDSYGYYHATNSGRYISFYDLACEIIRYIGSPTKVVPVTTEEYGMSQAVRPHNSRLDNGKLLQAGFELLPDWRDAVHRYIDEVGEKK